MRLKNTFIRNSVQVVLRLSAWLARRERLTKISDLAMTSFARFTIRTKRIRCAEDLADLGRQWQRGFPSAKQVPIREVTDDTVFAEIHTPCPLRGSGDVQACYRMMRYDREVLRHAGGQFVVLDSQAEPGRTICRVAMRRANADMADLVEAHRKDARVEALSGSS